MLEMSPAREEGNKAEGGEPREEQLWNVMD